MKNKKLITLIIAIVLSTLYIVIGNNITSKSTEYLSQNGQYDVYTGKIIEITDIVETEILFSGQTMVNKTLYFDVEILNGELNGNIVLATQDISPFFSIQPVEASLNDKILITAAYDDMTGELLDDEFVMIEHSRMDFIYALVILFFIGLIFFGKSKGFLTIISLCFTCASIFFVFFPAVLGGYNIYLSSIITCIFITVMTLIIVNGLNAKSISAGIGCIGGILLAGAIAVISNVALKITGMVDEQSIFLQAVNPDNPIDLKAIVFAAIIIGAIGAIMDVAISISSALNEIKEQNPNISFKSLYKSGITIGKDIMGTMTNTLILAYIGGSLSIILLLIANTGSTTYLLNTELIITEVLQSLIGSLGILLTLPLTSLVSSFLYCKKSSN